AVFAYDLHGTGPYGPIEWGQYMGGADHRGYYETGKNLPNDAFLTAQAHGAGAIASSDGGINCGASCIHKYPKGTTVTLTAGAGSAAAWQILARLPSMRRSRSPHSSSITAPCHWHSLARVKRAWSQVLQASTAGQRVWPVFRQHRS